MVTMSQQWLLILFKHTVAPLSSILDHKIMEKAEDFLLVDDPTQFSDEFSDPDEWDVS